MVWFFSGAHKWRQSCFAEANKSVSARLPLVLRALKPVVKRKLIERDKKWVYSVAWNCAQLLQTFIRFLSKKHSKFCNQTYFCFMVLPLNHTNTKTCQSSTSYTTKLLLTVLNLDKKYCAVWTWTEPQLDIVHPPNWDALQGFLTFSTVRDVSQATVPLVRDCFFWRFSVCFFSVNTIKANVNNCQWQHCLKTLKGFLQVPSSDAFKFISKKTIAVFVCVLCKRLDFVTVLASMIENVFLFL